MDVQRTKRKQSKPRSRLNRQREMPAALSSQVLQDLEDEFERQAYTSEAAIDQPATRREKKRIS